MKKSRIIYAGLLRVFSSSCEFIQHKNGENTRGREKWKEAVTNLNKQKIGRGDDSKSGEECSLGNAMEQYGRQMNE